MTDAVISTSTPPGNSNPADIARYCQRRWDRDQLRDDLLPTGVLVGTARIAACTTRDGLTFEWHLTDVRRFKRPRKPMGRPQPIWWWPL